MTQYMMLVNIDIYSAIPGWTVARTKLLSSRELKDSANPNYAAKLHILGHASLHLALTS